jgi:hypothetical protein
VVKLLSLLAPALAALVLASACGGEGEGPGPTPTPSATARAAVQATSRPTSTAAPTRFATATPGTTPTAVATPTAAASVEATPTVAPTSAATPTPLASTFQERKLCPGGGDTMVLLVETSLLGGIRAGLDQFESDLCAEGHTVVETAVSLAAPPDIRAYLAEQYAQTPEPLAGAILVGDLPHAYQWFTVTYANPDIPPSSEEVISFQYYADLDGVFEASPGYASPGGYPYSYDVHSGDVDWEMWIGILPVYRGDAAATADAINRYFAKNHAYRTGDYDLPPVFLQVSEHDQAETPEEHASILSGMQSGEYAWTPFSSAPDARLYFDSPPGGLSVDQGYADLSEGLADFAVLEGHGSWAASGRLDIAWAESQPVSTAFFWSDGCAVGNLDHSENFLTSVLYSPTSMVVVAKGTTNDSGGLGTNENGFYGHNIATALAGGASFGEAMLAHVNVPLAYPWSSSRELHFATPVVLGDPTLKLQR